MRAVFCWLLLAFFAQVVQAQELSWPTTDQSLSHNSAASGFSNQSNFGHLRLRRPGSLQNLDPQTGEEVNSAVSASSNHFDFGHLRLRDPRNVQNLDLRSEEEFCAYIRAYRVRREYKGSDVVIPAGQTTCLPSSRFNIRSAVMTQTESSPVK